MSLQQHDLRDLVDNILEIDSYKSKMGADKDIVTVAFATKTKESADDLASFMERGYTFVLHPENKQTAHIKCLLNSKGTMQLVNKLWNLPMALKI